MWNELFTSWAMQKHSKARGFHWKREVFCFCQISWLCVLQCWVQHSPQLRLFHLGETMTHPWWEIPRIHNVVLILLLSPVINEGTVQAYNKHQDRRVTHPLQWLRNSPHVNLSTSHCLVLNDLWVCVWERGFHTTQYFDLMRIGPWRG